MSKPTPQQIALYMVEMEDLLGGLPPGAYGTDQDPQAMEPPPPALPSGHDVVDGVAGNGVSNTRMVGCTAASCAHNVEGSRCELDSVNVNRYGGCAEYEATAGTDPADFPEGGDAHEQRV